MTQQEQQEQILANDRALKWFDALTPAGKVAHLQRIGILDRNGQLSRRYGGSGEDVPASYVPLLGCGIVGDAHPPTT